MSRTIRVFWPNMTSGWVNFNWGSVIDHRSVVHVAAAEGVLDAQSLFGPLHAIHRHQGAAVVGVRTVAPQADIGGGSGVTFYLEVFRDAPLNVVTDITVLDPPEDAIVVG